MFAARNVALCTKDCVCLYVCPTGATDTENGSIDADKCIDGCRLCVDSCPSGAIYLVYERIPKQEQPKEELTGLLSEILVGNAALSIQAETASETEAGPDAAFFKALAASTRVLAEDCVREAGHLVPDQDEMEKLICSETLKKLYERNHKDAGAVEQLLSEITAALREHRDVKITDAYVCGNCGYIGIGEKPDKCGSCGNLQWKTLP